MLEDKLKLALSKQNFNVTVRSSVDGSLKNSRNGLIPFIKLSLSQQQNAQHYPKTQIKLVKATKSSKRYSSDNSVGSSRITRIVTLNNRGLKQDPIYLNKNTDTYQTSYRKDFSHFDKEQLLQASNSQSCKSTGEASPQDKLNSQKSFTSDPSNSMPNILDNISVSDPIWSYLIPEKIFKDPNVNLEKLIEENYDYFANLLGLVFDEKTSRDFTFNKLTLPSFLRNNTSYSSQFTGIDNHHNHQPQMTASYYETIKPLQESLGIRTSYQHFYKPQPLEVVESCKQPATRFPQSMSLLTSYQVNYQLKYEQNFMNWRTQHDGMVKKVYNKSTGNLPFLGKSSYTCQYKANDISPSVPLVKKTIGPFARGGEMVYKTSHNSDTFRPQELIRIIPDLQDKEISPVHSPKQNNYQNQYQTTSQRHNASFKLQPNQIDPLNVNNKRAWKKILLEKFQELRQRKI